MQENSPAFLCMSERIGLRIARGMPPKHEEVAGRVPDGPAQTRSTPNYSATKQIEHMYLPIDPYNGASHIAGDTITGIWNTPERKVRVRSTQVTTSDGTIRERHTVLRH